MSLINKIKEKKEKLLKKYLDHEYNLIIESKQKDCEQMKKKIDELSLDVKILKLMLKSK